MTDDEKVDVRVKRRARIILAFANSLGYDARSERFVEEAVDRAKTWKQKTTTKK